MRMSMQTADAWLCEALCRQKAASHCRGGNMKSVDCCSSRVLFMGTKAEEEAWNGCDSFSCQQQQSLSGLAAPVAWCLPLACGLEDQVRVAPVLPAVTPPGCTKVMLTGLSFFTTMWVTQKGNPIWSRASTHALARLLGKGRTGLMISRVGSCIAPESKWCCLVGCKQGQAVCLQSSKAATQAARLELTPMSAGSPRNAWARQRG